MDLDEIIGNEKKVKFETQEPKEIKEKIIYQKKPISDKQKNALIISRQKRIEKDRANKVILAKIKEIEDAGFTLDDIHKRVIGK